MRIAKAAGEEEAEEGEAEAEIEWDAEEEEVSISKQLYSLRLQSAPSLTLRVLTWILPWPYKCPQRDN